MTIEERQLIADILRQRIIEIAKLFKEGGYVPQENVLHFVKGQIMLLAKDLDHALAKPDAPLEWVFLEAVQREIARSEGRLERETQEAEENPFDKLRAAVGVSEDGFVPAVDPGDLKGICRMGRETLAAALAAGATGSHAIGMSAYKSVCSPGANVTAAWYRVAMLGLCERMGLLEMHKRDGEVNDAVFRVAATFPMKKMDVGTTYHEPPFDVEEFVKQIERASAG
jgi:hypothetical protein